jgi:hypothetical protein
VGTHVVEVHDDDLVDLPDEPPVQLNFPNRRSSLLLAHFSHFFGSPRPPITSTSTSCPHFLHL